MWAPVLVVIGLGVFLTIWAGDDKTRALAAHLGMALLIAGILATFYQLNEVSHLFRSIARSTLIDNDYLEMLNLEALRKLRKNAAATLLKRGVTNPSYERIALEQVLDRVLYTNLLPAPGTTRGLYREHYDESVRLEFVSMEEAARALGLSEVPKGPDQCLTKETSTATYTVIAPRLDDALFTSHRVQLSGIMADVPGVPMAMGTRAWCGPTQDAMSEVHFVFKDRALGAFSYEGECHVPFVAGRATVCVRLEEWRYALRQPHFFQLMALPTRGIAVEVHAAGWPSPIGFEGDVVGLEGDAQVIPMPSGIRMKHDGWFLEGHGYSVWWWAQQELDRREEKRRTRRELETFLC